MRTPGRLARTLPASSPSWPSGRERRRSMPRILTPPITRRCAMTAETIAATKPQHTPTVSPTEPVEEGKGGEGGDFQITNAEFIAAVFTNLPEGAFAAVCSKSGDPDLGGWLAHRADQVANSLAAENNNYVTCWSLY